MMMSKSFISNLQKKETIVTVKRKRNTKGIKNITICFPYPKRSGRKYDLV